MQKFEEKIKSEYVKMKIKLKKTGQTAFVRQIHTDFFGDDEEISNLKLSSRFIARIIRDCGRKISKRTYRAIYNILNIKMNLYILFQFIFAES